MDSQSANHPVSNLLDGDINTFWHTEYQNSPPPFPHQVIIDTGGLQRIKGFTYLPRQDSSNHGNVAQYELYFSQDGMSWGNPVSKRTWSFTEKEMKIIVFKNIKQARFIKLVCLTGIIEKPWAAAAEIDLLLQ